MAPKRKGGTGRGRGRPKKAKASEPESKPSAQASASVPDLVHKLTYSKEVGIDLDSGGSDAVFQWLCCSIIFGNRISEKTTIRAARGLIESGLTDPKACKDSDKWEKVEALNSQGNVQRGPSMAERIGSTAETVLEKYDGDLNKLREAGEKDPEKIKTLLKEFKGIGEVGVNIFLREAQLVWEELFPHADDNALKLAKEHSFPSASAKELAEFVGNDRKKFVTLLAGLVKDDLRDTSKPEEAQKAEANKEHGKPDDVKQPEADSKPEEKPEEKEEKPEEKEEKSEGKTEPKDEQKSKETAEGNAEKSEEKVEGEVEKPEEKSEQKSEVERAESNAQE